MYILPIPQKLTIKEEKIKISETSLACDDGGIKKFASDIDRGGDFIISFTKCENDDPEYHTLVSKEGGIDITYASPEGAFRAYTTLKQILSQAEDGMIEGFEIEDYPAIRHRAFMLDISRGKIPKLDSLKKIVDILVGVKYNELSLYLDSFAIEYKNFPEYTKDTQPLTKAELAELIEYCRERFMTVVPNQNSFGHMAAWTAKPEIAPLAITGKDGKPSQTLNPLLPGSLELIDKIYDGYFDMFDTDRANVGMDETVDLGKNETKEVCDEKGVGAVYTDYLKKICSLVTEKYHKSPMFYDDIIFKHPEQLENVPKNAIVMHWGYETEHHYDRNCRAIRDCGLRFYVCPGTSMWGSFIGRSNNSLLNITTAAECGAYYGAEGFMLTEWGDDGHPQFTSTTHFPVILAGAVSWNCMSHDHEIAYEQRRTLIDTCKDYINDNLYNAKGTDFADIVYRMGNYYLLEEHLRFNGTDLYHLARNPGDTTGHHRKTYKRVCDYMKELREELATIEADPHSKEEILLNADIVILFTRYIAEGASAELDKEVDRIVEEYVRLWNISNHPIGSELFVKILKTKKQ
ncbi:MAG: family 20 glycosylhydrolase [Clostridia bacterium]|nr:family 20 glycosylhydrolase [Clostridia bacterium]